MLRQDEWTTHVRFYDCLSKDLPNEQLVVPINEQQFELYVSRRIEREKSLVGQVIVGFHPKKEVFMTGKTSRPRRWKLDR